MQLHKEPEIAAAFFGWRGPEVAQMTKEEYCARVIGRFFSLALPRDEATLLLDYRDLNAGSACAIGRFFNLGMPPADSLGGVFSVYSKAGSRSLPFVPDGERKLAAATKEVLMAAERWALPPYESLLASRTGSSRGRSPF